MWTLVEGLHHLSLLQSKGTSKMLLDGTDHVMNDLEHRAELVLVERRRVLAARARIEKVLGQNNHPWKAGATAVFWSSAGQDFSPCQFNTMRAMKTH